MLKWAKEELMEFVRMNYKFRLWEAPGDINPDTWEERSSQAEHAHRVLDLATGGIFVNKSDSGSGNAVVTRDSLESLLDCGRRVAKATGGLDLEAYRLAQWWDQEGAAKFIEAQAPQQRERAHRFWLERYTAEQTRIRIELARHCVSSRCVRQQFKEEIFGLFDLFRCGSHVTDSVAFLPYSAANAILDFLGEEASPEIKGPRSSFRAMTSFVRDNVHPSLQIRFGVGKHWRDIWEARCLDRLSSETSSLGLESESASSASLDSVAKVRWQGRRAVEMLLLGYPTCDDLSCISSYKSDTAPQESLSGITCEEKYSEREKWKGLQDWPLGETIWKRLHTV
jgi:hypothetical protein